jgi:hypothetical protein
MDNYAISALGMGTVFLALIALSLILTLFPVVFRTLGKKAAPSLAPLPMISSMNPNSESAPAMSAIKPELVAVIAAAVVASSGMAIGSFRVTSVEAAQGSGPSGFNTPVWGYVDRLNRSPFKA